MNQVTAQRKMVQEGPVCNGTHPIDSLRSRSLFGSNTQWQSKKKVVDNKAIKLNELSSKSFCRSSSPSSSAFTSSNAISDVSIDGHRTHRCGKKNPRKKAKKKGDKSKEVSCDFVSAKTEVLSEDSAHVCSMSEVCGSNDLDGDHGSVLGLNAQEILLPVIGVDKNDFEGKFERIMQSLEVNERYTSEVLPCAVQNFNGIDSMRDSEVLSAGCCNDVCSRDFSVKNVSSDSLPIGLDSDCVDVNLKLNEKDSLGIDPLEEKISSSREVFLPHHNLVKGVVDGNTEIEKVKHGIQGCTDIDTHLVLPGKKTKLKRIVTRSSKINRFGGAGSLQGHTGKENNHTVWQKVQRNNTGGCHPRLDKINPVCKQFKDPCIPAGVQIPKVKDKKVGNRKQLKDKFARRLKRKNNSGQDNIHRSSKNCHGNTNNTSAMICKQWNEMLDIPSTYYDRNRLSSVSRSHFQNDFIDHCINSESFQNTQVYLDGLGPIEIISNGLNNQSVENDYCPSPRSCNSLNQSNLFEVPLPVYLPHLFFHSIDQVSKRSSLAEHRKHNTHSRSTIQNWVPNGAENSRLTPYPRPDCSYLECARQPAECGASEKSIQERVIAHSKDPVPVVIEGGQSSKNAHHGLLEDEHMVQKTASQDATPQGNSCELDMDEHLNCKSSCEDTSKIDTDRMGLAVNDVCRAQLASEAVEMETGCPIAEFERLLHLSSPVISQRPKLRSCQVCPKNLLGDMILCNHEIPNISLGCLWQWYEKHGSYGLEIKAEDNGNSNRLSSDNSAFRAYFVPFLSAIQLFKSQKCHPETIAKPLVLDSCVTNKKINEPSDGYLPIFSVLFPKPRSSDASILRVSSQLCSSEQPLSFEKSEISERSVDLKSSGESELVFEYFEMEQPQQRRPLFDKIQQLVRGDGRPQGKTYGDPTMLNSMTLNDLHAGSWYSVAWYPIYRIPDGNFRAAFLTYHSLGHFVFRTSQSNSPDASSCIVSPVVGLQSYNAQNECWFQPRNGMLNPPGILDERLRTLKEAASLMARAVVKKGNQNSENNHPDYEYFLSRRH